MKKVRRVKQERKRVAKKSRIKYFIWGIVVLGLLAIAYRTWGVSREEIDLNKLEYVIGLPSDKSNLSLILKEPIMEFKKDFTEEDIKFARTRYAIVQSKYKDELVANVFIAPVHYQDSRRSPSGLSMCFEVYNMYVAPKYRGRSLSISHLYRSLKLLKEIYKVDPKQRSYIILHISPKDRNMDKAYALYRTNGFVHGLFTQHGSYSLRNRSEEFLRPRSIDTVVKEYLQERSKAPQRMDALEDGDKFLCMFTRLEDFFKTVEMSPYTKKDYEHHKKNIEHIRKPLLEQYNYN